MRYSETNYFDQLKIHQNVNETYPGFLCLLVSIQIIQTRIITRFLFLLARALIIALKLLLALELLFALI